MNKGLVADTIERAQADAKASREAWAAELRMLLRRNDTPRPDDVAKLKELASNLGIPLDNMHEVLLLCRRLDGYEAAIAKEPELRAAELAARQELAAIDKERMEAHRQIDLQFEERSKPVDERRTAALGALTPAKEANRWLENARSNWRRAMEGSFGDWLQMAD